ncbi:hypothetical protein GGR58DRAFT_450278 [Xylaria digitata]|nr:hypothetical protein GGR58DRAFT_450278 [Xylaria digitata]
MSTVHTHTCVRTWSTLFVLHSCLHASQLIGPRYGDTAPRPRTYYFSLLPCLVLSCPIPLSLVSRRYCRCIEHCIKTVHVHTDTYIHSIYCAGSMRGGYTLDTYGTTATRFPAARHVASLPPGTHNVLLIGVVVPFSEVGTGIHVSSSRETVWVLEQRGREPKKKRNDTYLENPPMTDDLALLPPIRAGTATVTPPSGQATPPVSLMQVSGCIHRQ